MIDDWRVRLSLSQEGQWINIASQHHENAGAAIRSGIDGAMNALIRVEGPDAAAEFAFALSDRVVSRVRAVTTFPPAQAAPSQAQPIEAKSTAEKPSSLRFWSIFTPAWLCGFIVGAVTR